MGPIGILTNTIPATSPAAHDSSKSDPTKIAHAASQFEALMIGQILKAAHGSGSEGWLGAGDDDDSSATAIQIAEEYLGQSIANSGGLGIAKMVVKGLSKSAQDPGTAPISASSGPTPASPSRTDSAARK